jgi:hypothetical protein
LGKIGGKRRIRVGAQFKKVGMVLSLVRQERKNSSLNSNKFKKFLNQGKRREISTYMLGFLN